jgi:hypothetical protein
VHRGRPNTIKVESTSSLMGCAGAAALAVANRDRFELDSSSQQLDFLGTLGFRPHIVPDAAVVIDRAEKQLDALLGAS